jgi:hypothetical protein
MELIRRQDSSDYLLLYRVQSGDSISRILYKFPALRNNRSAYDHAFKTLKKLNPQLKNPDLIFPGQLLVLPPFTRFTLATSLETDIAHQAQELHQILESQDSKTLEYYGEHWAVIGAIMELANHLKTGLDSLEQIIDPLSHFAYEKSLRPVEYVQEVTYRLQQKLILMTQQQLRLVELQFDLIDRRSFIMIESTKTHFRQFTGQLKTGLSYAKKLRLSTRLPYIGYAPDSLRAANQARVGQYSEAGWIAARDIAVPLNVGYSAGKAASYCITVIVGGSAFPGLGNLAGAGACAVGGILLAVLGSLGVQSVADWGRDKFEGGRP